MDQAKVIAITNQKVVLAKPQLPKTSALDLREVAKKYCLYGLTQLIKIGWPSRSSVLLIYLLWFSERLEYTAFPNQSGANESSEFQKTQKYTAPCPLQIPYIRP